jgi:hypothetical protein
MRAGELSPYVVGLVLGVMSVTALMRAQSAGLTDGALVAALRRGGLVLVIRHASAPTSAPSPDEANADNPRLERQLDAAGREAASAIGRALRRLQIPIGAVLTSPTYRARETARRAGLTHLQIVQELGDQGASMQAATDAQGAWLRKRAARFPRGTDTIIITQLPNIAAAFPAIQDVAAGEMLAFGPDGQGGAMLRGRIRIEAWPALP